MLGIFYIIFLYIIYYIFYILYFLYLMKNKMARILRMSMHLREI